MNIGKIDRTASFAGVLAVAVVFSLLAGCRVQSEKNGDGKNVSIATPFGGLHVNTNAADVMSSIGLPPYPGAQVEKKDGEDKDDSADVNMSFGGFMLRVKAAKFRTTDPTSRVEAFYRDGLKRYGDVIACRNHVADGAPARTSEGLTCDNNHGGHLSVDDSENSHTLELRAGSQLHQHLVTIDPDGAGTKFSLVVLDLPAKTDFDGSNPDTRQ